MLHILIQDECLKDVEDGIKMLFVVKLKHAQASAQLDWLGYTPSGARTP